MCVRDVCLYGYLARAVAAVVVLVVDHTKLTGGYTLYGFFGMHDEFALARALERSRMIFGGVAYLEAHVGTGARSAPGVERKEVEIVYGEVLFVGCGWLEAFAHKEHIGLNIFLYYIPRTSAKA